VKRGEGHAKGERESAKREERVSQAGRRKVPLSSSGAG
jgi:hypothetical protein